MTLALAGCASLPLSAVRFTEPIVGHAMLIERNGALVELLGVLSSDGIRSAAYCEEWRQSHITTRTPSLAKVLNASPDRVQAALVAATPTCTAIRLTPTATSDADVWIAVGRRGPLAHTVFLGGLTDDDCRQQLRRAQDEEGIDVSALHCLPARLERR